MPSCGTASHQLEVSRMEAVPMCLLRLPPQATISRLEVEAQSYLLSCCSSPHSSASPPDPWALLPFLGLQPICKSGLHQSFAYVYISFGFLFVLL